MNGSGGGDKGDLHPQGSNFAELLSWHLAFGTRPPGSPSQPKTQWTNKEFAHKAGQVDEKTVRNWRSGKKPVSLQNIEEALFGDNNAFLNWRMQLRRAYAAIGGAGAGDRRSRVSQLKPSEVAGAAGSLAKPGIFMLPRKGGMPNTNVRADTVKSIDASVEIAMIFDPIIPPSLHAEPIYIGSHAFIGREDQLAELDNWAAPGDPNAVFLVSAIGGAGKSFLAWEWVNQRADDTQMPWAGRFWYSFYEGYAGIRDFLCKLLSYMSGLPADIFDLMDERALRAIALDRLRQQHWLIVMDGVERLLVHYQRSGSSHVDDRYAGTEDPVGRRDPRAMIRLEDGLFLRSLLAAKPSKVLITSRLVPTCLVNSGGHPLPGLKIQALSGLSKEDACAMLRTTGVSGGDETMGNFLKLNCDCHPLVVGALAGIINNYLPARGDFEAWLNAEAGGQSLNLADLDLVQRRNDILKHAIDLLPPDCLRILSVLALISTAVDYPTLEALILPAFDAEQWIREDAIEPPLLDVRSGASPPAARARNGRPADLSAVKRLQRAVTDLEGRGLLQFDRDCQRYDLHPVVRGVVVGRMGQGERRRFGGMVVDHFSNATAKPFDQAQSIDDIQAGLEVLHAFTVMEDYAKAYEFFKNSLELALRYILEREDIILAILRPFFKDGWADLRPELASEGSRPFNSAGITLNTSGMAEEGYLANQAGLLHVLGQLQLSGAAIDLLNIASGLFNLRKPRLARKVQVLATRLADTIEDKVGSFVSRLDRFSDATDIGDYAEAQGLWEALDPMGRKWAVATYRQGEAEYRYARFLFYQGKLTEDALVKAEAAAATSPFSKYVVRLIAELRGAWRIELGDWTGARAALAEAVRTDEGRGSSYGSADIQLLRARHRLGEIPDTSPVLDAIEPLERGAEIDLAELRLDLGDRDGAQYHAARAMEWAIGRGINNPDAFVRRRVDAILGHRK